MAGLIDLDELALRCRDKQAKAYIEEAVACYKGGAFRACIVAAWNAVVFDFLHKLRELELAGDKNASKHLGEFERIRAGGEGQLKQALEFERHVLTVAEREFELLTAMERSDLARLQEDRNRCAHPSMQSPEDPYQPAAELARMHLRNTIELMLERPPVQGKAALERLVSAVESNYFPTSREEAVKILDSGPLARPRDVLVRNFVLVLVKTLLKAKLDEQQFKQRLTALEAVLLMHREIAEKTLAGELEGMILNLEDEFLRDAVRVLLAIDGLSGLLRENSLTKLRTFTAAMPVEDLALVLRSGVKLGFLEEAAVQRIQQITAKQIATIVPSGPVRVPRALVRRVLSLYKDSGNFDAANELGQLLERLAPILTTDDIHCIFQAAGNSQVLHSFGLYDVLSAIRRRGMIDAREWNDQMRACGLDTLRAELMYPLEQAE